MSNKPSTLVRFTPEAWSKMWQYTFSVEDEISGYGRVNLVNENGTQVFIVDDVTIFTQAVSGADTEISGASVASFLAEMHKRGENPNHWRLWWHSHNRMAVFWSGTDELAMSPTNNIGKEWLLSVVVNFKQETKARLDVYTPTHMKLDDIEVENQSRIDIPQSIIDEVKAKVTKRAPVAGYYSGTSGGMYQSSMYDWDETPSVLDTTGKLDTSHLEQEYDALMPETGLSSDDYLLARDVYAKNYKKLTKAQRKRGHKLLKENDMI